MVKLYESYIVKKVVVNPGDGAPTFTYLETPKRSDGFRLPLMRVSESERRSDSLRMPALRLNESEQRADDYRIPSISFTAPESAQRREDVCLPLVRVSDSRARSDTTTVAIEYTQPGSYTFTVPAGIVGGVMKLEGIGAGGSGGPAVVNGGGGGKGGGYARRNAQVVTAGQQLLITVPASPAVGAVGSAATVVIPGGQTNYSVSNQSASMSGAPDTTSTSNQAHAIELTGSVLFVAASSAKNTGFAVIPAQTQAGDYIIAAHISNVPNDGEIGNPPTGFTRLFYDAVDKRRAIFYKIATSGDAGQSLTGNALNGISVQGISVYRGATSIALKSSSVRSQSASQTATGYSDTQNNLAVMVFFFVNTSGTFTISQSGLSSRVNIAADGTPTGNCTGTFIGDIVPNQTPISGTTLLSAPGGNAGGAGSATAGGTGATSQSSTAVGDVTFTGGTGTNGSLTTGGTGGAGAGSSGNATGNTAQVQFGVTPTGSGGASAAAGTPVGGAGGGATTLAAAGVGARGGVRLTFTI